VRGGVANTQQAMLPNCCGRRGSFAELMRRNGVFAELYNTQFRDTQDSRLDVA
jgi:hypothetical protein